MAMLPLDVPPLSIAPQAQGDVVKTDLTPQAWEAIENAMNAAGISTTEGLETIPAEVQALMDAYGILGVTIA